MSLNLKSSQDGTKAIIGVNGGEQFQISSTGDLEIAGKIKSQSGAALTSDSPIVMNAIGAAPTVLSPTTYLDFRINGASIGSVETENGTSVIYSTTSDYRLKENLQPLTGALDRLDQIPVYRFNFKGAQQTVDGFVAHEVQPVVPEAVTGTKDQTTTLTNVIVNSAGNIVFSERMTEEALAEGKENGTYTADCIFKESHTVDEYQGIDQSKLVPLLVAAVKELRAEIEILKQR